MLEIYQKFKNIIYKKIIMPFGNTFLIPYFKHSKVILYSNQHSGNTPPHTISIVKHNGKYLGYIGPQGNGSIDLFFSDDLLNWKPYKNNPIIKEKGCRWPSVLKVGNYIYMAYDANFCTDKPANIVLKKAKLSEPYKFEFVKMLTKTGDSFRDRYNSYLFYDGKNKQYCLYFHTTGRRDEIRGKFAKKIEDLDKAEEKIICYRPINGDQTARKALAAPSMMHINGYYILQTEAVVGYKWVVEVFISKHPDRGFRVIKKPLLPYDQACPFPYVEGNKIYDFIAERGGIRILDSANIEAIWNPWFLGVVIYEKDRFLDILNKLDR
jgi:hypothetical protein